MRDIKNTIKLDVSLAHGTSKQVATVIEDFREFIQLFDQKNREYGSENAFVLGSAGQFADIWRKIGKLKTALWDKKPEQLTSEGTEEIIQDLIGHLFLTLQCLRKEQSIGSIDVGKLVGGAVFAQNIYPPTGVTFDAALTRVDKIYISDDEAAAIRKKELEVKRAKVRELYPQIGEGSLMAREEESLDWLISAAKPTAAYKVGEKVKSTNIGGYVDGLIGTIESVDTKALDSFGGNVWYSVDFGENAGVVTCSEKTLEAVK